MIISIASSEFPKASVEIPDDSDIVEVMHNIYGVLVAYGFHPDTVRDGFIAKGEELEEEIHADTKQKTD